MNFSCTQQNISKALNTVSRFTGGKTTTLPILNNILLTTDNGRLKLSATNLEIGINTWIGAKVEAEGSYTLPSKLFIDFVSTNNDSTINIKLKDNSVLLESPRYKASIKGIISSEFPLIPLVKDQKPFFVNSSNLKRAISETIFASAIDETRPVLGGIYLIVKENKLILVATDSYRLAEKTISLNKNYDKEISVIVPTRILNELARIMEDDQEVGILVGDSQIQFSFGEIEIISRLIEGNYPDYKQIIPKSFGTTVEINNSELKNAIKMASYFVRDGANNIRIKTAKDNFIISSYSAETGDSVSTIPCKIEGDDIEITFNAKYILDELNIVQTEFIEFKFNDKLNPGLIIPKGEKDYLYIIMPLRIEE